MPQKMKGSGYKKNKKRVTIFACSNASGNLKLKPMVISKSKKPRSFKNIHVHYKSIQYSSALQETEKCLDGCGFAQKMFFDEFVYNLETLVSGDIKTIFFFCLPMSHH